jgi:pimeloyl-ACP methyl ester carboxylesterase
MQAKRTFTTNDKVTLTYHRWRCNDKPKRLIILLHGLGSNHTRWLEFIDQTVLSEHWDIIAPDLRGHSESLTRSRINMDIWAQDLYELMRHEGYNSAVVIGHSLGAHIALAFYQRFPRRVRGLGLVDPLSRQGFTSGMRLVWHARWIGYGVIAVIRLFNHLGFKRRHITLRNLREFDERARELIAQGKEQEMVKNYNSPFIDLKHNPLANYLQCTLEVLRPLPEFEKTDLPTLLLLSQGSIYNKGDAQHDLIEHFTNCTVVSVNCNHWLLTEQPRKARRSIEAWMQNQFGTDDQNDC